MAILQQIKDVYRALPPWVTAPVKYVPNGVLFGRSFRTCVPRTDLGCLGQNLKAALDYAREHTVWGRENIPDQIAAENAEEIIADLPIVGAEDLSARLMDFVSDEATELNSYKATTGMNKIPTVVRLSNAAYGVEWAHMLKIWKLGGYDRHRDLKLTFRSYQFDKGPFFRYDPIYNELSVDPAQQTDENFKEFLREVRKHAVTCIHGYPTFLKLFMERLRAVGENYPVRQIMLGSEGADPSFKKELGDFFGARIISWYGMTEKVALAYDEFADGRFTVFTSYGFPRIIDPDEKGVGEIVATSFVNKATPLVNYRTGDFGRIVNEGGRLYIEEIQGRSGKDFIWLNPHMKYPATPVGFPDCVQQLFVFFQIVQNEYGKIDIRILPSAGCEKKIKALEDEILRDVIRQIPGVQINLIWVRKEADLERSHRGKLMKIIQNMRTQTGKEI